MRSLLPTLLLVVGSASAAPAATLEVHTQPAVEVYWEGILLATTDADGTLTVEDVPEGPFELELRKPGYERLVTTVEVGSGTTRLDRELVALPGATAAPTESSADSAATTPSESSSTAATPAFSVSTGAWWALAILLGVLALTVLRALRGRRKVPQPTPAVPPRVTRERAGSRTFEAEAPAGGGTFLSELRQRERNMDDLIDVSRPGSGPDDAADADVVDVSWKEVE